MYSKGKFSYLYLPVNVALSAIENTAAESVILVVWADDCNANKTNAARKIIVVFFIRDYNGGVIILETKYTFNAIYIFFYSPSCTSFWCLLHRLPSPWVRRSGGQLLSLA